MLLIYGPFSNVVLRCITRFENVFRSSTTENRGAKQPKLDLVICLVIGPRELLGLKDLLESASSYLEGKKYKVIVVDDSGTLGVWRMVRKEANAIYLRNMKRNGPGKLPQSLAKAYVYALHNYSFHALLKVDADSLITGNGLAEDIHSRVEHSPAVGMLGSYKIACDGSNRTFNGWEDQFKDNWDIWGPVVEKAQRYGYELGETAQGGGYVISYECLRAMEKAGYFDFLVAIGNRAAALTEDVTYSLLLRSLGFKIDDFARPGEPFAIAWRGLPMSKEEIVRQNKKVIHSIKFNHEDLETRQYFRALREKKA